MDESRENSGRCSSASATPTYSLSESAMFSQRIVTVDFYSAAPIRDMDVIYSEFRGYEVKRVPVIRIFGATPKGQKTCTHVHCVFPYFYVPFDPNVPNLEYRLAIALDNAINLSISNKDAKNMQHVYKIIKVTGKSFYGYKGPNDVFLKIFFYSPWLIKKAVELLQNGKVMDMKFQPYEAHIPYTLQFMIDYNLYGMNLIHFSSVKFRLSGDKKSRYCHTSYHEPFTVRGSQKVWDLNQIPEYLCVPLSVEKMSKCDLEVDVLGSHILIADSLAGVRSSNPGIDAIWMDEVERRKQEEVENWSQITIPESQSRSFDKKRFPTEDNHFKTLLSNITEAKQYEKETYSSLPTSDFNTQLPSSQLNHHTPSNLPFAQEVRLTSTHIKSNSDDEELLNLLLDLANEKEREEYASEIGSSLGSQVIDVEQPHVDLTEEENIENVEELWNESFVFDSLSDDFLDEVDKNEAEAIGKPWGKCEASNLAQLDGQDDSDDSDDDKNVKTVKKPRRSSRISSETISQSLDKKIKKKFLYPNDCAVTVSPKKHVGRLRKSATVKLIELAKSPDICTPNFPKHKIVEELIQIEPTKTPPTSRSSTPPANVRSSPRLSMNNQLGNDNETKESLVKAVLNLRSTKLSTKLTKINPQPEQPIKKAIKSKPATESESSNANTKRKNNSVSVKTVKDSVTEQNTTSSDSPVNQVTQTATEKDVSPDSTPKKIAQAASESKPSETNSTIRKTPVKKIHTEIEENSKLVDKSSFNDQPPLENIHHTLEFTPVEKDCIIISTNESNMSLKDAKQLETDLATGKNPLKKTKKNVKDSTPIKKGPIIIDVSPTKLAPAVHPILEVVLLPEEPSTLTERTQLKVAAEILTLKQNHESLESATTVQKVDKLTNNLQNEKSVSNNESLESNTTKKTVSVIGQLKTIKVNVSKLNEDVIQAYNNTSKRKHDVVNSNVSSPDSESSATKQAKIEARKRLEKIARPKSITNKQNTLPVKTVETPLRSNNSTKSPPIADSDEITEVLQIVDITGSPDRNKLSNILRHKKPSVATASNSTSTNDDSEKKPNFGALLNEKLMELQNKGGSPVGTMRKLTDDYLDKRVRRPSSDVDNLQPSSSSIQCVSLTDSDSEPVIIETVVNSNKNSTATTPVTASRSKKRGSLQVSHRNLFKTSSKDKLSANASSEVSCQTDSLGIEVSSQTAIPQVETSSQTESLLLDAICQTDWTTTNIFGDICQCYSRLEIFFKEQGTDTQGGLMQIQTKKLQTQMGDIIGNMRKSGDRLISGSGTRTSATVGQSDIQRMSTASTSMSDKCNELITTPKSSKKNFNKPLIPSTVQKFNSPRRVSPNSNLYEKYITSRTPSPRKPIYKQPNSTPLSVRRRFSPGTCSNILLYPLKNRRLGCARLSGKMASPRKSLDKKFQQTDFNSSITSVYEYHGSTPENEEMEEEEFQNLSKFQRRRSETKARNINRVQSKRAKHLHAYKLAPDICEASFEPMKLAPSFKALERWAHSKGKHRAGESLSANYNINGEKIKSKVKEGENTGNSSDEESIENVRRVGGGNLSDEDDDDCSNSPRANLGNTSILTQSPLLSSQDLPQSQTSGSYSQSIPRSILKSRNARRFSEKAKRKIRWDDEGPQKNALGNELRKEALINAASTTSFVGSPSTSSWVANISELDGPSPKNLYGFEHNMSNLQDAQALHTHQYLTTMCVEIYCNSRESLVPNPNCDAIQAIFIYINSDFPEGYDKPSVVFYHLIVDAQNEINAVINPLLVEPNVVYFADEISMMNGFVSIVHRWDPDIFTGFEIQKQSIGYIIERGMELKMNMLNQLSRIRPTGNYQGINSDKMESWNETITGRIVLNLWRVLRHEISVQSYTYENTAYHVLHRRVHLFSYKQLTIYWNEPSQRRKVVAFYHERVKGAIEMIEKLDIINRTSELARLFGIQFYEVLSRGSQFRVESMMLRISKPKNYIPPSPSISQRAKMRAPEFLPLILEPYSDFYTDPVAVLDFQSLYPSMMIAYNYDYSTCLGRVEHLGKQGLFDLGCLDQSIKLSDLEKLKSNIHVSPAGVAFVDTSIRKGVLPEMLEQILETRQMVKRAIKRWKGQGDSLMKILDSRQLGLKLIANVTYGYTSANFSGRMPCVDIADSVVSKGRETLQRAIDLVKSNFHRWGGDVVYGDTDSLFICFKGKTREEAFVLAQQIVDEVTQSNPKPVKLKLEKVYQPCVLQSKKRYVGYMYETPDQKEPKYEAKGIETVRRDGCPAVKKILEKTLHILFTTKDIAKVKHYVETQFSKIFVGRVSLSDFTFAKEYRGRAGYKPGACVPSLEIAKKIMQTDQRAEPLESQRVPYVIVYGNPGLPLIKLVQTPLEFVNNPSFRLNAHYYIEKAIIPALNRCLILAKLDARKWLNALPRKYLRSNAGPKDIKQVTLAHYFSSVNCLICDANTYNTTDLCDTCRDDGLATALFLQNKCFHINNKFGSTQKICLECSEAMDKCVSIDCPVFHKLLRYNRDNETFNKNFNLLKSLDW